MSTFGENLRALRTSRGYSQDKFARAIGSNQITLSSWETGYRVPALSTIQHIADTFKVPLSSLLPIDDTGFDSDYVNSIADTLKNKPKLRTLFDRIKYMSDSDIEAVMAVVEAITRGRTETHE